MPSAENWFSVKRDPRVFTKLIKRFGVTGAQVEELWTIDEGIFENLRPVHGLIFIYEYEEAVEPTAPIVNDERLQHIFFAKQVINNACATHDILNLLLNCNHPDIQLGPNLTLLKNSSMAFDPNLRGITLRNYCQNILIDHNSLSQGNLGREEVAYNFIGYIPIHGRLYELDGLRDGPIDHGPIDPGQDWLDIVRPIIQERMNIYNECELNFGLMALVSNLKMIYERRIDELISENNMLDMDSEEIENEIRNLIISIQCEDIKNG